MRPTFREFVRAHPFAVRLREDEAAPSIGGAPPAPGNPDNTTNAHHFDSLARGLGMDDDDMTSALEGNSITVWQVPNYYHRWGFLVSGPVDVSIEKRGDNYELTYQLRAKQRMEPKSFYLPYKQGERPMYYKGTIKDEKVIVSAEELQDLMTVPYKNMPPGGMGGGMGGMGAPPGGAPPMGGMGGPPPGPGGPMGAPPGGM